MLKKEKQEMNYLSNSNALWDYFEFPIAHVGNILSNQAMLPDWALDPYCPRVIPRTLSCMNYMNNSEQKIA